MEPKINEKLKTFTPTYICSHELGSFLDTVLERMKPLDDDHRLYLLTGLVEQVYQIGVSDGIDKSLQRIALVIKQGAQLPKDQFFSS
jgi:hypothetical protein